MNENKQNNQIITVGYINDGKHQQDFIQHEDGISRAICCGPHGSGPHLTKTMFSEPIIIDDYNQRIPKAQDVIGTITTQFGNSALRNGQKLIVPQATAQGYVEVEPGSIFDGSYPNSKTRRGRLQDNGQSRTTLTANGEPPSYYEGVKDMNYRIRKLTPREVFRLMGVSESDIDKIQAAGISNSQQYKMAGNSIVVDVLEHIFRKLLVDRSQETQQLRMF